jgi:hypothetical protein
MNVAGYLLSKQASPAALDADLDEVESIILDTISEQLKQLAARDMMPVYAARVKHGNLIREASSLVREFISTHVKPKDSRARRFVIFNVVCCAVDTVNKSPQMPLCYQNILYQLRNVATLVDSHFPGYRQAGLLTLLADPESFPNS